MVYLQHMYIVHNTCWNIEVNMHTMPFYTYQKYQSSYPKNCLPIFCSYASGGVFSINFTRTYIYLYIGRKPIHSNVVRGGFGDGIYTSAYLSMKQEVRYVFLFTGLNFRALMHI